MSVSLLLIFRLSVNNLQMYMYLSNGKTSLESPYTLAMRVIKHILVRPFRQFNFVIYIMANSFHIFFIHPRTNILPLSLYIIEMRLRCYIFRGRGASHTNNPLK